MKLIISGGTGYVATALIKQSLELPLVTELVVLSRRPISTPTGIDAGKLKNVLLKDYDEYPKEARDEMAGADAFVWTVSVTPSKSRMYKPDELNRVCHTCTLEGLKAALEAGPAKPFRFIYTSGGPEDYKDSKIAPAWMTAYLDMRRQTEREVREMAKAHDADNNQVGVVRPGLITSTDTIFRSIWGSVLGTTLRVFNVSGSVTLEEVAAATLQLALKGVTKDTLENDEIGELGKKVLEERARDAREAEQK